MRTHEKLLLLLLIAFALIETTIHHPIIAKWALGEARYIGYPVKSKIYTDGKQNKEITLYHVNRYWHNEKADYFLIIFPQTAKVYRNIFLLDKMHNAAAIPSSTNINDYDKIWGCLFQTETGAHYSLFQDDIKGFNFDPKLTFKNNTIMFNMPQRAETYKCDSVRIELL
jgi:hypothetical protein